MTEKQQSPKLNKRQPGFIGLFIFTVLRMMVVVILAWFVLLIWLAGEAVYSGQPVALDQANNIISMNVPYYKMNTPLVVNQLASILSYYNVLENVVVKNTVDLLLAVTHIISSRLNYWLHLLPILMLLLFVAITDGLVKRDIRKFQGARESTFTFHRIKGLLGFCLLAPLFIFLSVPLAINPMIIVVPQMIALSVVMALSITYFKKYL